MLLLTEVSKFELSGVADEQVLWFQVAVKDVSLVNVGQPSQQLEEEQLEDSKGERISREWADVLLSTHENQDTSPLVEPFHNIV